MDIQSKEQTQAQEIKKQEPFRKKSNKTSKRNPKIQCLGCLENQPNQLAHMDYGGCLYSED